MKVTTKAKLSDIKFEVDKDIIEKLPAHIEAKGWFGKATYGLCIRKGDYYIPGTTTICTNSYCFCYEISEDDMLDNTWFTEKDFFIGAQKLYDYIKGKGYIK